jgi:hypothetical protein
MRLLLVGLLAVAALAVPAGGTAGSGTRAPAAAVAAAKRHVLARFRGISGLYDVAGVRSRRDPRWALVRGGYSPRGEARDGIWAAWLRRADGRWRVVYAGLDTRAKSPPARAGVPCDIRPAFAEPRC